MKIVAAGMAVAAVAACVPRSAPPEPPPQPEPVRQPAPPPVEAPPPPPVAWEDAELSPGDWSYEARGGTSFAAYGPRGAPNFVVACEPSRQVTLARIGPAAGNQIRVRTSYGVRALPAAPQSGARPAVAATLAASDPLLDQMAFSRGRFAVEAAGAGMLIVPAWPEVARVVEDCRR